MAQTNGMIEKMTANRSRARLAYGETNERRQRNNKLHKPERSSSDWNGGIYEPANIKRVSARKRVLHHLAVYAYIED